jgi:hypothetical protein
VKTGLKTYINKYTPFFTLILTINLYSQIPVKGFCKYSSHLTEPGYNSLFSFNFNNDSYTDFLLFSSDLKRAGLIEGDAEGVFTPEMTINFRHNITSIKNLSVGEIYSRSYVYLSRKERTAGLINFKEDGRSYLLAEHKFDSYPEKIDVADVDLDLSPEVLVAGAAFKGISLLNVNNGKIFEKKAVKEGAYKDAAFIDFSRDGIADIAAVNIFKMRVDLFTNNSRGEFRFTTSIPLNNLPYNFNTADMDLDDLKDIIWSEKGKIIICFSDPFSLMEEQTIIKTHYNPHLMITGDFNRDGNIDITYADTAAGVVSVLFGRDQRKFSEEVPLFRKKNLVFLIPYYSRFITGIAVLSSEGIIYTVEDLITPGEKLSLAAGLIPGAVKPFDYMNDGIADIVYIDEGTGKLNLVIRNADGVPEILLPQKIHYPHKEITVDDSRKTEKVFYCWTKGEKLVEILSIDLNTYQSIRTSLYSTEKIQDLVIETRKDKPAVIYAAYIDNGTAGANIFEYHDFRYTRTDYKNFASDVVDVLPFTEGKEAGFFTWQKREKLFLYKHYLRNLKTQQRVGELPEKEYISSFSGDLFNNERSSVIASLEGVNGKVFITADNKMNKIQGVSYPGIKNSWQFYSSAVRAGGLKRLFVYLPEEKSLQRITLFNRGKDLILSELISGITVRRFFVKNLNPTDYHLVYSDSEENCITIAQLK